MQRVLVYTLQNGERNVKVMRNVDDEEPLISFTSHDLSLIVHIDARDNVYDFNPSSGQSSG